jgi:hypothetical protein
MFSTYYAGLHCQSLSIDPTSGKLQFTLKPANKSASIPSFLELSRGITAFGNIIICIHTGLSEVYLIYSRQRRRDKYLLTIFIRENTYIDVVKREVLRGLDITDFGY